MAPKRVRPVQRPTRALDSIRLTPDDRAGGFAWTHALAVLFLVLPGLLLVAALVPPSFVPHRMAFQWASRRLEIGVICVSVLVVETALYLLAV